MTPDEHLQRIARTCSRLAEETGDSRFSVAAGILSGGKNGRPEVDDADLLDMVAGFVQGGMKVTPACRAVSRMTQPPHSVNATFERLRKKYKETNI